MLFQQVPDDVEGGSQSPRYRGKRAAVTNESVQRREVDQVGFPAGQDEPAQQR
jgi:hypothetical protein